MHNLLWIQITHMVSEGSSCYGSTCFTVRFGLAVLSFVIWFLSDTLLTFQVNSFFVKTYSMQKLRQMEHNKQTPNLAVGQAFTAKFSISLYEIPWKIPLENENLPISPLRLNFTNFNPRCFWKHTSQQCACFVYAFLNL